MFEFPCITLDPDLLDGKPCLRHLPVPAARVLSCLAAGQTWEEIQKANRGITVEDIRDALLYAAWRIEEPEGVRAPERNTEKPKPAPSASTPPELGLCPIVLTRVGVFDRRFGVGIIAWRDIEQFSIVTRKGGEAVSLELMNPQRYLVRMPNFRRHFAGFMSGLGINPFVLLTDGTGLTGEQLLARIKKGWLMFRGDKWLPAQDIPEFSSLLARNIAEEAAKQGM